ncbi:MAG: hypothetical protein KDA99_28880, partial [Planctomycetales bacterium]|nr:hypothetical protein [Planctomycetales bacterium]
MGIRAFYRDTRHLWTLALLLGVVVAGFIFIRGVMVPPTFGDQGPYRAAVLDEIKQLPSMLISDATCLECHAEVGEERE